MFLSKKVFAGRPFRIAVALSAFLLTFLTGRAVAQPSWESVSAFVPDRLIIQLRPDPAAGIESVLVRHSVQSTSPVFSSGLTLNGLDRIYRVNLSAGSDVLQVMQTFTNDPDIEWAEPDYLAYRASSSQRSPSDVTPNDPLLSGEWGLSKIAAPAAWEVVTGSPTVAIAIVDSGMDLSHPDLASKLWVNPGEIAGNGLDDDNNGFVDDVNGWDFVNDDNNPSDDEGHGTQVAGVAVAVTNNAVGIAGLCWNCRIMPVKVMQASGAANYSDIAAGVAYAAQKGAKVINLSLGGYSDSHALHTAIQSAVNEYGAVVVGGAGNDNSSAHFYPAAYDEVLAVAGTDESDVKATISNYGDWVDVTAPAVMIMTTFMGGDYGIADGTSFAASFVSGLAGLVRSQHAGWSPALVGAQIIHTADPVDPLNPGYAGLLGSGRINADAAVSVSPHPILTVDSIEVNGDPLGRPAPGETADLQVALGNGWLDATGVQGTLSTSDTNITVNTGTASFGSVPSGGTGTGSPLYGFSVASGAGYNHAILFNLHVTANGGAYSVDLPLTLTTRSANENVGGTIGVDTTWTNDKTYIVINNVGIAPGVMLTIQAGTMVKFNGNYSLNVGGVLVADGTQSQPIRFMSNTGGSWGRIYFDDTSLDATADLSGTYQSGNLLRWVNIESAAQGIGCNNATPYLSHVTTDGGGSNCVLGATTLWVQDSMLAGGLTVGGGGQIWRNSVTGGGISLSGQATIRSNTVGGSITVGGNSTIQNTTANGSITLNGYGTILDSTAGGTVSLGSGTVQNTTVTNGGITISSGSVLSNTLTGGGISAGYGSLVRGNNIENGPAWGIHTSGTVTITQNRLVGNASGIYIEGGLVQGNLIANQSGIGLSAMAPTCTLNIISNTFTGVGGSAILAYTAYDDLADLRIEGNNFECNTGLYDIENLSSISPLDNIAASGNWWGTTDPAVIDGRIFDYNDDYTKSVVQYAPAASGPIQSAPAYVRGMTLDPESPVGIETVQFKVLFSRPMDENINPEIAFSKGETNLAWINSVSMPTSRYNLGVITTNDGKVYTFGGVGDGGVLNTVEVYDPSSSTWSVRSSMPTSRAAFGIALADNGKIYVIGGYQEGFAIGTPLNTVEEYDPATDTWRTRASMPTARFYLGAASLNGKIYAIGGYIANMVGVGKVEEYDPIADTWKVRNSMPTPRGTLGVTAASDGWIYAIGGFNAGQSVEAYNASMDFWSRKSDMPTARELMAVTSTKDGKIFVIGGWQGGYFTTVEEYDTYLNEWIPCSNITIPRNRLAATTTDSDIFAIGGMGVSDQAVDTVEKAMLPFNSTSFYNGNWLSSSQYSSYYDINSLVPRGTYITTLSGAIGADGIEIAPNSAYSFTVDYAGAIGDTTPPLAPIVQACATNTLDTLSAFWSALDPDSVITLYQYAIGTTEGGTDVVNWTITSDTSITRNGLNLIAGQTYYVSVKARNAGGLWSPAESVGVAAGSGLCAASGYQIYLPVVGR